MTHLDPDGGAQRETAITDAIRNRATMPEVRGFAGHSDIRTIELDSVRKEEDAEVTARRIPIRIAQSRPRSIVEATAGVDGPIT